jgi:hypothetical protein
MKQLLILDRQFNVKKLGLVKTSPTIFDTISPQKTTLELLKDENVNIGNIISIKQYDKQEFLGIVQDVAVKDKTELYVYPFINAFNCECTMESINGYVYDWIVATMEANFVDIADNSLKLNLEFRNMMTLQPSLSYIFSDGNLFEALKKIFYITGVYLEFSLKFVNGIAVAIYCDIYNTNDYGMITIRYDNPLLGVEKPVIENSMNYGTNKIILKPEEGASGSTYAFYLLEDNTVTTDESATGRLVPVNQKIARYAEGTSSGELQLIAEKELLGEAYDHNIYFTIKRDDSYKFELYRKVKFISEDRTYISYCSKIDKTQDNVLGITLGVIRNNLTAKIKDLEAQTSSLSSASTTGSGAIIPVLQWGNIGGSINNQADLKNALAGKIPTTEKGAVNGVATLGADGKLSSTQMPAIRVTDVYVVSSQAEMLALEADEGDVAKRTDLGKSFMLGSGSPTLFESWIPVTDDFEPLGAVSDHNASETAHSTLLAEKVNPLLFYKTCNLDMSYTWDNAINKANVLLYATDPTKYNAMLNPWSGEVGGGSLTYSLIGFEERPIMSDYIYTLTFKGSDNRVFSLSYDTASDTITVFETTDENFTAEEQTKLSGIEEGAEVNVQSDWNQTTDTADDYIKNKPTIPESVVVVDNLTSTSTTSALSANQGKVLNDKISILNEIDLILNGGYLTDAEANDIINGNY